MSVKTVLRNDLSPLTQSSANVRCSIVLTDSQGSPTNTLANVSFIYFVMPQNSLPLCTYMLNLVQNNIVLHSDLNGYAIFTKNGTPEHEVGQNNSWSRLAVTLQDSYPSNIIDGEYFMNFS